MLFCWCHTSHRTLLQPQMGKWQRLSIFQWWFFQNILLKHQPSLQNRLVLQLSCWLLFGAESCLWAHGSLKTMELEDQGRHDSAHRAAKAMVASTNTALRKEHEHSTSPYTLPVDVELHWSTVPEQLSPPPSREPTWTDKNTLQIHSLVTSDPRLHSHHKAVTGSMEKLLSVRQTFRVCVQDDTTRSQICHKNEHISYNFLPFGVHTHLANTWQRGGHRDVTAPEQSDHGASIVPRQNTPVLLQPFLLNV